MAAVREPVSKKGAARYCAKMTVEMNSLAPPPANSHIIMRLLAVGVADLVRVGDEGRGRGKAG